MKKILWFAGLYLLIGAAVVVLERYRNGATNAQLWRVPEGFETVGLLAWPYFIIRKLIP